MQSSPRDHHSQVWKWEVIWNHGSFWGECVLTISLKSCMVSDLHFFYLLYRRSLFSLPFPPPPISYVIFFHLPYHGIWPLQLSPPLILESFLMPSGALGSNGWRIIWLTLLIFQIRPHRNLAVWWNAFPALNTCVCAGGVMVTWPWSWFLRGGSLGRWGRPWLTTLFSKKKVLCMEDCWKACSFLQILYSSFFERSRP